jgi:nucleoside-diphosphate-sugar epimerase
MQFVYVRDLVDLMVRVMEMRNAIGHAFNTANPKAITQHEVVNHLAQAAGCKDARFVSVPREAIYRAGGQVVGEKLYFGSYYDVPAITQIITKEQRMLAFKPTEFDLGLKVTYRAYVKKRIYPRPDFSFEDELLSARLSATRSA